MAEKSMIYGMGVTYLLLLWLKSILALIYVKRYSLLDTDLLFEDVTICTPILSGDPQLIHALQANLAALPESTFFWLIDADDIEAQRVTAELVHRYPKRAITVLVFEPAPAGINPKLFKLEGARNKIMTKVIVVLDDDTRLPKRSLQALLAALSRSQLATGLPYYREARGNLSNLLGQFVNNNSAQTYLPLLNISSPVSINGMCYAMRTSTLREVGGFKPLLSHLTDDLAMADLIRSHGGKIHQTPFPQEVGTTIPSHGDYVRQMHRWFLFALLLMRRQSLAMNVLITLLHGIPPLLLGVALALGLLSPSFNIWIFISIILALRAVTLVMVQRQLFGKLPQHPFLSLMSELLQPFHLLHAVFWRRIRWRSRTYQVFDNDRFEPR